MRSYATLILAVGALALAGCAKDPPLVSTGSYELAGVEGMPEPSLEDTFRDVRPYQIGPFDRLGISVWGVEGLEEEREVTADATGTISFPIAGTVSAAGLTPLELQERLRERLVAAHVRNPQVTVNLIELRSQLVTVEGEVNKPGIFPVLGEMTLLRSIATAQGAEPYARDDVVVFREVGGRNYAAIYDLRGIQAGNYADPAIYGGDIVVVGRSNRKLMLDKVLAAVPAFLSPIVLLIR